MGATRTMARRIVAARAEQQASAAGSRVKAPGKFRRFLFKQAWAELGAPGKRRKRIMHTRGHEQMHHRNMVQRAASKLGVSL